MISQVSADKMAAALAAENPGWTAEGARRQAEEDLAFWDDRLAPAVRAYVEEGKISDFHHGEFSLLLIQKLRHGCGFLRAAGLMDAYLKDPLHGKAHILKR